MVQSQFSMSKGVRFRSQLPPSSKRRPACATVDNGVTPAAARPRLAARRPSGLASANLRGYRRAESSSRDHIRNIHPRRNHRDGMAAQKSKQVLSRFFAKNRQFRLVMAVVELSNGHTNSFAVTVPLASITSLVRIIEVVNRGCTSPTGLILRRRNRGSADDRRKSSTR